MMPSHMGQPPLDMTAHNMGFDPSMYEASRNRDAMLMESMRRLSRGANYQRPGGAMRIVKPSSASNSPQSVAARRRTMMSDSNMARRCQQVLDQTTLPPTYTNSSPPYTAQHEPSKRSSRPVSWHPGSYQMLQQQQQQSYFHLQPAMAQHQQQAFSGYSSPAQMGYFPSEFLAPYQQLPPTPAIYSGQVSPVASISPDSLPFTACQMQSIPHGLPTEFATAMYSEKPSPAASEPFPSFDHGPTSYEWDTLGAQDFHQHARTTPPTPEEYQPPQQAQPSEESIPFQSLDESEEEGEILVGMGLYDTPGKEDTDPELDNYRTSTSQLLGTTYRRGQGLKLEEAWEPPASDDEGDDKDEDAEGEGDDE